MSDQPALPPLPRFVSIEIAIALLKKRAVPGDHAQAMVHALANDAFRAQGLCEGVAGIIRPEWWRSVVWWPESGAIFQGNIAYFDLSPTRRVSQIEVDQNAVDRRWPAPQRRHGPVSTKDQILEAAKPLFKEGDFPGKTIRWEQFRIKVCKALNVKPEDRGYSLDMIQTAVRPLMSRQDAGSTGS